MPESPSVYDSFIPKELSTKCWMLVERFHKRVGIGNLVKRLTEQESMLTLVSFPPTLGLLGSANAAFKYRLFCWLAGAAVAIAGLVYSWWVFLGLIPVLMMDRHFAQIQYGSYMAIAATLLSLEMLVHNFGGWGTNFPVARSEAESVFARVSKQAPCRWLDYYLPNRAEIDPVLLQAFGPQ
jgi:hypothetical protein